MTERDDRRARLRELSDEFNWCNAKGRYAWLTKPVGERLSVDLRAELEASQRDRKALADYGLLHDGKAGQHWIYAAAGRLAAGDLEADVLADFGYTRDREALAVLRPGECSECKGTGEDWSNATPTACEACRGSTCGVVCDLVKNENCLQMAREEDREALAEAREHLSKTVALAERDRRNLLGLNDAVKGPGGGRAQLREWIAAHPEAYSLSSKGLMADLLIDIDSAERDRELLDVLATACAELQRKYDIKHSESEDDREALAEAREAAKHARQFLHNKQPGAALSVLVTIPMPGPPNA